MSVAYVVIAVLLALMLLFSASLKLRRDPGIVHGIHEVVGVPLSWFPFLALCEVAGAGGLLLGIAWAPIGVAAAVGVVAYMVGAVIGHVRVRDYRGLSGPVIPLLLAIAALVTGISRF